MVEALECRNNLSSIVWFRPKRVHRERAYRPCAPAPVGVRMSLGGGFPCRGSSLLLSQVLTAGVASALGNTKAGDFERGIEQCLTRRIECYRGSRLADTFDGDHRDRRVLVAGVSDEYVNHMAI